MLELGWAGEQGERKLFMTEPSGQENECSNLNHRRDPASVRHCPACGRLVNANVAGDWCSDAAHATRRRERTRFCPDCGVELIPAG